MDSRGFQNTGTICVAHSWIGSDSMTPTGEQDVKNIQLRGNLKPTPARNARIDPGQSKLCERCCRPGTLAHLLQACPRNHQPRIVRQNHLVSYVQARYTKTGYKCLAEPRIAVIRSFRKSNIVVWMEGEASVLDVTIMRNDQHPDTYYKQ